MAYIEYLRKIDRLDQIERKVGQYDKGRRENLLTRIDRLRREYEIEIITSGDCPTF